MKSKKSAAQLNREINAALKRPVPSHVSHATKARTPAELARDIASLQASPKLGDPTWEATWAEALAEKHSKARLPTLDEIAHAFAYIDREFRLQEGKISGEHWAEGLAYGQRSSIDAEDKRQAREALDQLSAAKWLRIAERANRLAQEQQQQPRYVRS